MSPRNDTSPKYNSCCALSVAGNEPERCLIFAPEAGDPWGSDIPLVAVAALLPGCGFACADSLYGTGACDWG